MTLQEQADRIARRRIALSEAALESPQIWETEEDTILHRNWIARAKAALEAQDTTKTRYAHNR